MGCSVRPWAFLHPSASFLACGSPGEPFEECASPRTVLPFSFPPLAPAKHCPRALLVLLEGGLQSLCCSGLCFWSQGVASAPIGAGGAEGGGGGWRRGWEEKADFHVSQRAQAIRFVQLPKNKEALTVLAALTSLLSAPEDSV